VAVGKEHTKSLDETLRPGDVIIEDLVGVLPDDDAVGSLEEDVVLGVSGGKLLLDLLVQVVGGVFRFPVAVWELECIHESAVNNNVMSIAFD